MEIMNTKVEFSKGRNRLQRPPSFESTKNEELSILSHNNPPPQEHRKVKLDVPLENKRYSRVKHLALKPYSVELAIQGSHGPQLLEGFKFMKTPHNKESLENAQGQGNVNTEKEKLEEVPKLTENEKKLQRYLANAGNKKEERMIKRLETKEARLKNASPAPDDSLKSVVKGIERLRLVSRNQKREIKITERSNERETMNKHARKVFEGFSGKKLDELFAFISPRREKFVGFMPFDKQKNNICSFNKCAPSSERSHSSNIKVEVDMQTKKITYGVGNIKTGQHMSARSRASSDSNSMKNTFFSVKTASVSRNSKPIKENKSGRRVSSRIETPEPSSFGLDLESEMRQPSRLDAQPKLPKLPLQTKISSR